MTSNVNLHNVSYIQKKSNMQIIEIVHGLISAEVFLLLCINIFK